MSTTHQIDALERIRAHAQSSRHGLTYYVGWAVAILIAGWAWQGAEIRPLDLVKYSGNIVTLANDFFPPNFMDWRIYIKEMIVTIHIALWGTLLAIAASIPLGFLCASNVVSPVIYQPARRLMDALRAVNEMVFALLFIVAVGLGPFAGVLALFVHTTGTLSKLISEAVETIDTRPVEGIRAAGGSRLAEIVFGIIPQVLPMWISFCLYRFESNVRSASVVGMVGAGGIGVILYEVIRSFQYAQTCAVLIILIGSVTIIDVISAYLRKQVT